MARVEGDGYEYQTPEKGPLELSEREQQSLVGATLERDNIEAPGDQVFDLPELKTEEEKRLYVKGWVEWAEDSVLG